MPLNLNFEPTRDLFEAGSVQVPQATLMEQVLQEFKSQYLIGTSSAEVQVEKIDEDSILVKKIDPEKALGYQVFPSEDSYFNFIAAQQYSPSPEELGLSGTWTA